MSKRLVDLRSQRPLLDIASFGRRGPEAKLTTDEVTYITRTARRVPEVMIKVSGGRAWTAYSTPGAPIAAWGDYHIDGSRQLRGYLLSIEWYDVPTGHHSLWCYCDPKRPTEWTVGRGRHGAAF
jgi:hypothetical protein